MPLFSLPNLSATQVAPIEPWTAELNHAPPAGLSKGDLSKWMSNPNTNGIFLSAFEGMNPHIRVGKANNPFRLHGLIADYDATMSEQELKKGLQDHAKAGMRPAYAHRTYSGHGRVIWLFESPLLLPEKLVEPFLRIIKKETGAPKLLPGLDDAILDPSKYYHYMGPLFKFSEDRISDVAVNFMLSRAFDSAKKYRGEGDQEIPLDEVRAAMGAGPVSEDPLAKVMQDLLLATPRIVLPTGAQPA